jgi:hypothetical protein
MLFGGVLIKRPAQAVTGIVYKNIYPVPILLCPGMYLARRGRICQVNGKVMGGYAMFRRQRCGQLCQQGFAAGDQ